MNQYPGWNGGECVQQTCSTCMYYDPSYGEKESSRFFGTRHVFFFRSREEKKLSLLTLFFLSFLSTFLALPQIRFFLTGYCVYAPQCGS